MDVILRTRCGCSQIHQIPGVSHQTLPPCIRMAIAVGAPEGFRHLDPLWGPILPDLTFQSREFRLYNAHEGVPEYREYVYPTPPSAPPLKFRGRTLTRDEAQTLLDAVGEHEDQCDRLTSVIDSLTPEE